MPGRGTTSVILAVVAALLATSAAVLGYVRDEIVERDAFTGRVVSSLDDPAVQRFVADRLSRVVAGAGGGDLVVVRPLLARVLAPLSSTPPFRRLATLAARDVHRDVVGRDSGLVVTLRSATPVVRQAVRAVAPGVADRLPTELRPILARLGVEDAELEGTRRLAERTQWRWWLAGGALAAALASIALASARRRAVARLGVAAAVAGLLVAAAVWLAGAMVSDHAGGGEGGEAADAVGSALFGDLASAALLVAGGGFAVVVLLSGGPAARRLHAALAARRRSRVPLPALAAGLFVLGVAFLLEPDGAIHVVGIAVGLALCAAGLSAGAVALESGASGAEPTPTRERRRSRAPALIGGMVVAVVVLAIVIGRDGPEPPAVAAVSPASCNGSPALCDRRLDQVVFAGTHNSYAAGDQRGWYFPNQRRAIERQLDDGIRSLMLDVHLGVTDARTGRVRTDLEAEGGGRNKVAEALSPEALRLADRLAGRVGGELRGPRSAYLCHTACELGAEPLDDELRVIRDFLARKPGEVVMIVFEPYVTPAVVERALDRSGLLAQAAELDLGAPLPTLGELAAAGTRLVVLTEEEGGARPWYLPAFTLLQDTRLTATRAAELDCGRFRGDAASQMLLLNHWLAQFPPRPSDHRPINRAAVLRERWEACAAARGVRGGVIAVDFHDRSDVVAVARDLNRRPG